MSVKVHRTLFVGLGGFGKAVLQAFRRQLLETYGTKDIPAFEFLVLDTDDKVRDEQHLGVVEGYDAEAEFRTIKSPSQPGELFPIGVSIADLERHYSRLRDPEYAKNFEWFDAGLRRYPTNILVRGASQMRAFGRLAFELAIIRNQDLNEVVQRKLDKLAAAAREKRAWDRLGGRLELAAPNSNEVFVNVISSTAGGTGSGTFLEFPRFFRAVLRKMGAGAVNVQQLGLYLILSDVMLETGQVGLPGFNSIRPERDDPKEDVLMAASGYAALCELEAFQGATSQPAFHFDQGRSVPFHYTAARPEAGESAAGEAPRTLYDWVYLVGNQNKEKVTLSRRVPPGAEEKQASSRPQTPAVEMLAAILMFRWAADSGGAIDAPEQNRSVGGGLVVGDRAGDNAVEKGRLFSKNYYGLGIAAMTVGQSRLRRWRGALLADLYLGKLLAPPDGAAGTAADAAKALMAKWKWNPTDIVWSVGDGVLDEIGKAFDSTVDVNGFLGLCRLGSRADDPVQGCFDKIPTLRASRDSLKLRFEAEVPATDLLEVAASSICHDIEAVILEHGVAAAKAQLAALVSEVAKHRARLAMVARSTPKQEDLPEDACEWLYGLRSRLTWLGPDNEVRQATGLRTLFGRQSTRESRGEASQSTTSAGGSVSYVNGLLGVIQKFEDWEELLDANWAREHCYDDLVKQFNASFVKTRHSADFILELVPERGTTRHDRSNAAQSRLRMVKDDVLRLRTGLFKTFLQILDHAAQAYQVLEGRLTDLAAAIEPPAGAGRLSLQRALELLRKSGVDGSASLLRVVDALEGAHHDPAGRDQDCARLFMDRGKVSLDPRGNAVLARTLKRALGIRKDSGWTAAQFLWAQLPSAGETVERRKEWLQLLQSDDERNYLWPEADSQTVADWFKNIENPNGVNAYASLAERVRMHQPYLAVGGSAVTTSVAVVPKVMDQHGFEKLKAELLLRGITNVNQAETGDVTLFAWTKNFILRDLPTLADWQKAYTGLRTSGVTRTTPGPLPNLVAADSIRGTRYQVILGILLGTIWYGNGGFRCMLLRHGGSPHPQPFTVGDSIDEVLKFFGGSQASGGYVNPLATLAADNETRFRRPSTLRRFYGLYEYYKINYFGNSIDPETSGADVALLEHANSQRNDYFRQRYGIDPTGNSSASSTQPSAEQLTANNQLRAGELLMSLLHYHADLVPINGGLAQASARGDGSPEKGSENWIPVLRRAPDPAAATRILAWHNQRTLQSDQAPRAATSLDDSHRWTMNPLARDESASLTSSIRELEGLAGLTTGTWAWNPAEPGKIPPLVLRSAFGLDEEGRPAPLWGEAAVAGPDRV